MVGGGKDSAVGLVLALLVLVLGGCGSLPEASDLDVSAHLEDPQPPLTDFAQVAYSFSPQPVGPPHPLHLHVAQAQSSDLEPSEAVSQGAESAEDKGVTGEEPGDEFFDPFEEPGEVESFEEYDPWEPYNVVVFKFNYNLDKYVIRHIARGYNFIVPNLVQRGIANVFHNIRFVPRFFNNIFQGKFENAGIEVGRFLINTTLGIGGLFDAADTYWDLSIHDEDFGQTLGYYGVDPGPYLLLPFWPRPFTIRDGFGYIVDLGLDPWNYLVVPFVQVDSWPQVVTDENTGFFLNIGLRILDILNQRSLNLETFQDIEEATVDLYTAVRNAYLQRRARAIQE